MHNRLRAIRKALRMNQKDFAAHIGLNQNSLSMIEKNRTPFTEKNIKLVCMIFNVDEQWLRTGSGKMFSSSPYERKLREICMNLSIESQESLLLIAQELLKIQSRTLGALDENRADIRKR